MLDNVSGFDLSMAKMALLESYVRDTGGGLISLGGRRSYSAGGYHQTPLEALLPVARRLADLGFELLATAGTSEFLAASGLAVRRVHKVHEERPHIVDHLINREVDLVVNTPLGRESHEDDALIRRTALKHDIPCITTLSGALAAAEGIAALRDQGLEVASLQEIAALKPSFF